MVFCAIVRCGWKVNRGVRAPHLEGKMGICKIERKQYIARLSRWHPQLISGECT